MLWQQGWFAAKCIVRRWLPRNQLACRPERADHRCLALRPYRFPVCDDAVQLSDCSHCLNMDYVFAGACQRRDWLEPSTALQGLPGERLPCSYYSAAAIAEPWPLVLYWPLAVFSQLRHHLLMPNRKRHGSSVTFAGAAACARASTATHWGRTRWPCLDPALPP